MSGERSRSVFTSTELVFVNGTRLALGFSVGRVDWVVVVVSWRQAESCDTADVSLECVKDVVKISGTVSLFLLNPLSFLEFCLSKLPKSEKLPVPLTSRLCNSGFRSLIRFGQDTVSFFFVFFSWESLKEAAARIVTACLFTIFTNFLPLLVRVALGPRSPKTNRLSRIDSVPEFELCDWLLSRDPLLNVDNEVL